MNIHRMDVAETISSYKRPVTARFVPELTCLLCHHVALVDEC